MKHPMEFLTDVHLHNSDELAAIQAAEDNQKVRVSIETRIKNLQVLINDHVTDSGRRTKAIAALADFRKACEKMLNDMDIPF